MYASFLMLKLLHPGPTSYLMPPVDCFLFQQAEDRKMSKLCKNTFFLRPTYFTQRREHKVPTLYFLIVLSLTCHLLQMQLFLLQIVLFVVQWQHCKNNDFQQENSIREKVLSVVVFCHNNLHKGYYELLPKYFAIMEN